MQNPFKNDSSGLESVRAALQVQGQLGDFPDCLEAIMLGKESNSGGREKRQAAVVRVIMRKLLNGLSRIHSLGLIHRDVRPPSGPSRHIHTQNSRFSTTYIKFRDSVISEAISRGCEGDSHQGDLC